MPQNFRTRSISLNQAWFTHVQTLPSRPAPHERHGFWRARGYHVVDVVLHDGRSFGGLLLVDDDILIEETLVDAFTAEDIATMTVTPEADIPDFTITDPVSVREPGERGTESTNLIRLQLFGPPRAERAPRDEPVDDAHDDALEIDRRLEIYPELPACAGVQHATLMPGGIAIVTYLESTSERGTFLVRPFSLALWAEILRAELHIDPLCTIGDILSLFDVLPGEIAGPLALMVLQRPSDDGFGEWRRPARQPLDTSVAAHATRVSLEAHATDSHTAPGRSIITRRLVTEPRTAAPVTASQDATIAIDTTVALVSGGAPLAPGATGEALAPQIAVTFGQFFSALFAPTPVAPVAHAASHARREQPRAISDDEIEARLYADDDHPSRHPHGHATTEHQNAATTGRPAYPELPACRGVAHATLVPGGVAVETTVGDHERITCVVRPVSLALWGDILRAELDVDPACTVADVLALFHVPSEIATPLALMVLQRPTADGFIPWLRALTATPRPSSPEHPIVALRLTMDAELDYDDTRYIIGRGMSAMTAPLQEADPDTFYAVGDEIPYSTWALPICEYRDARVVINHHTAFAAPDDETMVHYRGPLRDWRLTGEIGDRPPFPNRGVVDLAMTGAEFFDTFFDELSTLTPEDLEESPLLELLRNRSADMHLDDSDDDSDHEDGAASA